jgi:uncharacterized NAD(P)/FAD-binding protein YdhS
MRTMQQTAVTRSSTKSLEAHAQAEPRDPLAALLPAGNPRYLRSSWSIEDLERIGAADRVLVLGTAREAVDAVLALEQQGHRGTIRLVSPRGLLLPVGELGASEIAERLAALQAAGRLEVCAGRVRGAAAYGDRFVVDVLPRGRRLHSSERYDWIVNCTSAVDFTGTALRAAH